MALKSISLDLSESPYVILIFPICLIPVKCDHRPMFGNRWQRGNSVYELNRELGKADSPHQGEECFNVDRHQEILN